MTFGAPSPNMLIVGIVKHARVSSLEQDSKEGFYYLPLSQAPSPQLQIAIRTRADAKTAAASIQSAMRQVDPNVAVYDFQWMQQRVDASLVGRRFLVVLLSTFAGLALLLAAIGLYGVISYGVRMRVRELGIRMALGAKRGDVLRLVIGQGMALAASGLVLGLIGTLGAGRVLESMLFATHLYHPVTLLATSLILSATVFLASYLPARRASKLDPMRTLREE